MYYLLDFNNIDAEWYKRHFSILKTLKFKLPPNIKEQNKIAYFLSSLDEKIENIEMRLKKNWKI